MHMKSKLRKTTLKLTVEILLASRKLLMIRAHSGAFSVLDDGKTSAWSHLR